MPRADSVHNLALKVQILSPCSRGGGGGVVATLAAGTNKRYAGLWRYGSGASLSPGAKCSVFRIRQTERREESLFDSACFPVGISLCWVGGFLWGWLAVCACVSACMCVNEEDGEKSLKCQDAVWGVKDSPVIYKALGDSSPFLSSSSSLLQTPLRSSLPLWDPQCWEEMCH